MRTIVIDDVGPKFQVEDTDYDAIDWGSNADDIVTIPVAGGGIVYVNWAKTLLVYAFGPDPGPGTFPGYVITAREGLGNHVNEATRDAIVVAMQGPGFENQILVFTTSGGEEYHVATANLHELSLIPHDLVISVP